jgi:hypothetical protein
MQKYKGTYIFKFERDSEGKIYNKFDNYISCRGGGRIYRYNEDTLIFESPKKIRLVKKDEKGNTIMDYSSLIIKVYDTEAEREIFFKEENIIKLEELFKIRKPKQLSEETREKARLRMLEYHKNKNEDIENLDLEEDNDEDEELETSDIEVE